MKKTFTALLSLILVVLLLRECSNLDAWKDTKRGFMREYRKTNSGPAMSYVRLTPTEKTGNSASRLVRNDHDTYTIRCAAYYGTAMTNFNIEPESVAAVTLHSEHPAQELEVSGCGYLDATVRPKP